MPYIRKPEICLPNLAMRTRVYGKTVNHKNVEDDAFNCQSPWHDYNDARIIGSVATYKRKKRDNATKIGG